MTRHGSRRRGSLLELLHPTGAPGGIELLGRDLPLLEGQPDDRPGRPDIVVIAPHVPSIAAGRLEAMCDAASRIVAPRGLVLLVAWGRARRRADALLRSGGLDRLEWPILITRGGALVSCEPGALRHAAARASAPWRRRALRLVGGATAATIGRYGRTLIAYGAPGTQVAGWLRSYDPAEARSFAFVPSWRPSGAVVAMLFGSAGVSLVAKVGVVNPLVDLAGAEARALAVLAAGARREGVRVPTVVDVVDLGPRRATVLSGLPGMPAALERGRALDTAEVVSSWLGRWTTSTSSECDAGPVLDRLLLTPLSALEDVLPRMYVARLRDRVAAVSRGSAPVAAVHGDLTLWNVLRSDDGVGVVDWENASDQGLPLMDLPYLLVDAIATEMRSFDRGAAYTACFQTAGSRRDWAAAIVERTRHAVGVLEPWAGLAVDACWLGHAADERRRGLPNTPFLDVLQRHAARTM